VTPTRGRSAAGAALAKTGPQARNTGFFCSKCEQDNAKRAARIEQVFAKAVDGTLISLVYCVRCGRAKRVTL